MEAFSTELVVYGEARELQGSDIPALLTEGILDHTDYPCNVNSWSGENLTSRNITLPMIRQIMRSLRRLHNLGILRQDLSRWRASARLSCSLHSCTLLN